MALGGDILPRLLEPLVEGRLGALVLPARPADPPSLTLKRIVPGDADVGQAILGGRMTLAGHAVDGDVWAAEAQAPPAWRRLAHGFTWLDDLAALGPADGRAAAHALLAGWLDRFADPVRPIWKGGAGGDRISALLAHWGDLIDPAGDPTLGERLARFLTRQMAHLALIGAPRERGTDRLIAVMGLVSGALALGSERKRLDQASQALTRELDRQILADGAHASRNPLTQARLLARLATLRRGYEDAHQEPPHGLIRAIDRMAPLLRFFRHGDGGLALFNGAEEWDAAALDVILAQANASGRPPPRAPHAGFERIQIGKTLLICDVGAPPPEEFETDAHAGALSFELSVGKERLVVNCGRFPATRPELLVAQKSTAAHSVLCVEDTNASAISADGLGLDSRRAVATAERNEGDDAIWLDMGHDGYWQPFGLLYRRRVYLSGEGLDLRGEEQLDGPAGRRFAIRFHLHPKVSVSLLGSKTAALLRLPQGGGWRFRAAGAEMALEDSLYFGAAGEPKRMQQIVLNGVTVDGSTTVKWAFQKEQG